MSQAGYELFNNLYGFYFVFLQVMLFLVTWNIFYSPERNKKTLALAGIFAIINVALFFGPPVPNMMRHIV
ncbi:MAG: ATP-binding protein, partial [Lachnospiraceae bacterium]|nr:ATP-binding protein [Lachnospiraceae bacterium]